MILYFTTKQNNYTIIVVFLFFVFRNSHVFLDSVIQQVSCNYARRTFDHVKG